MKFLFIAKKSDYTETYNYFKQLFLSPGIQLDPLEGGERHNEKDMMKIYSYKC